MMNPHSPPPIAPAPATAMTSGSRKCGPWVPPRLYAPARTSNVSPGKITPKSRPVSAKMISPRPTSPYVAIRLSACRPTSVRCVGDRRCAANGDGKTEAADRGVRGLRSQAVHEVRRDVDQVAGADVT